MATPNRLSTSPPAGNLGDLRFLVLGRLVPGILFTFLGRNMILRFFAALEDLHHRGYSSLPALVGGPIRLGLYALFVSIPAVIYVFRPKARAQAEGFFPRAAAFLGTTMLLFFGAFFDEGPPFLTFPEPVGAISSLLLAAATAFGLYGLLYLRLNFSIIPEARGLVRRGPYRFVRHPLYAAEILSSICLALPTLHLWYVVALLLFIGVQMVRISYEERILTAVHPEYVGYARRTARLIPFIW